MLPGGRKHSGVQLFIEPDHGLIDMRTGDMAIKCIEKHLFLHRRQVIHFL